MQPAVTGPYHGLKIAYLPRNSTPRQDGNYSQRRQRYVVADHITAGGGTPVPYDEGIASGRDLAKRPAALRALDDVAAGKLDGLAWEKVDRITRDEHGIDAGIISGQLARKRALLVTLHRDYRLWRKEDLRMFRIESGLAGVETLEIRDRMWNGVLDKARDEPFFMGVPPWGYTTVTVNVPKGDTRKRAKLERKPAKDDRAAPIMRALAAALDYSTGLGEVCARLNSQEHFRWSVAGELAGSPTQWRTEDVRRILDKPIYGGWWTLGIDSDGTSSIWDAAAPGTGLHSTKETHGGKIEALEVPQLAWFAPEQLQVWREKYPRRPDRSGPRHRKNAYPLRDVLLCRSCGRPMIGWRAGLYACPMMNSTAMDKVCAEPQYLSEKGAVRALLATVPAAVQAAYSNYQDIARATAEDDELDALRRRRDVRVAQTERMVAQWYGEDSDGTVPDAVATRLKQWKLEVSALTDQIRKREQILSTDPARELIISAVLANPHHLVEMMPADEQFTFLRLLFAGVTIGAQGWGSGRTFSVTGYRNLWLSSEVDPPTAGAPSVYHTIAQWLERHK